MLINLTDLGAWMGQTLDDSRATQAVSIAEGWLQSVTRLDPWPDVDGAPADLAAWCMELSALAYVNNPREVTQRITGSVTTMWAPTAQAQKAAILDAARTRYNTTRAPRGNFPPATSWPDPAFPRYGRVEWL